MTLSELVRQFLEYMEIEQGKSRLTLRNYDHYLTTFFNLLRRRKNHRTG